MKLGDFFKNKDILNNTKSIDSLLKKYNLSYNKFEFIVEDLNWGIPKNILSNLPDDLFNKLNNFLESYNDSSVKNQSKEKDCINSVLDDLEIEKIRKIYLINPFKAFQDYKDLIHKNNQKLTSQTIKKTFEKLMDF